MTDGSKVTVWTIAGGVFLGGLGLMAVAVAGVVVVSVLGWFASSIPRTAPHVEPPMGAPRVRAECDRLAASLYANGPPAGWVDRCVKGETR